MGTHISVENAKLARMLENPELEARNITGIASYSLPAGWSCPDALTCLAKVTENAEGKAKLVDGPEMEFRCFEATMESWNPALRHNNAENFQLLRDCKNDVEAMADVLESAIVKTPRKINLFRIHVGGDFFSLSYLRAWYLTARRHSEMRFFAYSKSLRFLVATGGECPENMSIVSSYVGRYDHLIGEYGLRSATVVYSEAEAERLGLEIDHDDSLAAFGTKSFALLIHGTQAKGTAASEALKLINATKRAAIAA